MPSLEELRERFSHDLYATTLTGVEIVEAEPGRALCRVMLRPEHMNANGVPMGGAVFTLADFTYAVAANGFAQDRTYVTQNVSISFLSPARGGELLGEARRIKDGRATCLYEVDVRDELGSHVAHAVVTGFNVMR